MSIASTGAFLVFSREHFSFGARCEKIRKKKRAGKMGKKRAEMKVKLMKEAEAVIDELLDWHEERSEPKLSEIEGKVLELRKRLSEEMAGTVIANQEAVRPVPGPKCQECGQEMRYKGQKKNTVISWVGAVEMERGYYYCAQCRTGIFPPGSTP
jgi:hypothetical protein